MFCRLSYIEIMNSLMLFFRQLRTCVNNPSGFGPTARVKINVALPASASCWAVEKWRGICARAMHRDCVFPRVLVRLER